MSARKPGLGPGEWLRQGRPLPPEIARALRDLLGLECSLDGLARLYQPSFPGVRAFVIHPRVAPDRAVELTILGVARDGRPAWTASRAFVLGRDGSVEIHRGFDEIAPAYQNRNATIDLLHRELELLALARRGPSSRLTSDAEGVGRYLCALHGFVYADETDEGPPVRSNRPFDAEVDRERLVEAAERYLEDAGRRLGLGRLAIEGAQEEARKARAPWDLARLRFVGVEPRRADGVDGAIGVTALGRDFLLARETPPWRAALYLSPRDRSLRDGGDAYRLEKTRNYRRQLDAELAEALAGLESPHRATRIRAIETLGMIGGPEYLPAVRRETQSDDRRVASVARRVVRMIAGAELVERMKAFASSSREDARWRGLVLRVLAEHYPAEVAEQANLLRVDPDARLQRAVLPVVAAAAQGPAELAAMLGANPANEGRPGLPELRLELIERLARRADPMTLPVLIEEYRRSRDDPVEMLALSRALVAFSDPRARQTLSEAMRAFERPPLP